jgi:regulator of cell morphogenesis and NO signaling
MSSGELEKSVVDWAIDQPQAVAVFEHFGVDYCCGGKSLEYACRQRGVDPQQVLAQIHRALEGQPKT